LGRPGQRPSCLDLVNLLRKQWLENPKLINRVEFLKGTGPSGWHFVDRTGFNVAKA
jgi:hypothetical protein